MANASNSDISPMTAYMGSNMMKTIAGKMAPPRKPRKRKTVMETPREANAAGSMDSGQVGGGY